jgi:hypothetical protein
MGIWIKIVSILCGTGAGKHIEKVTFKHRLEGVKEVNHVSIWGKEFQAEERGNASQKATERF